MYFSKEEVGFLMEGHRHPNLRSMSRIDVQTGRVRYPIIEAGCPDDLLLKILEDRARILGSKFTEFRSRMAAEKAVAVREFKSNLADLF